MRSIFICMIILSSICSFAQKNWCPVDEIFETRTKDSLYQQFLLQVLEKEKHAEIKTRSIQYFPVVIHAVLPDGYTPLSEAQVLHQIDVLNEDFAGRGQNSIKVLPEFQSLIADTEMQFCLATIDPEGQPTSGITHTTTNVPNIALKAEEGGRIAIHYDSYGGKDGWDPARYINIWVGEYGNFLGSASFPGMAPYVEEIGLVINHSNFGSIGGAGHSGYYGRGHTLTHEMGHFFGLKHIWGEGEDADCGDSDDIDDTPNAAGPYFDCPSGIQKSCDVSNFYQDFMDLTDDRCLAAFTPGQATRMQATVDVYYGQLSINATCKDYHTSFTSWFDHLVWSRDEWSNKYVIYSSQGWMGIKKISVFSADGKTILEDNWEDQLSYLLDLNQVSAGVYFVMISFENQNNTRKIIVL